MTDSISAILSALPEPVAILTDFDGTLVEIAPSPDAVAVPDHLPGLINRSIESHGGAFAIVSGRKLTDIDSFLPELALTIYGGHGAERRVGGQEITPAPSLTEAAQAISNRLRKTFEGTSGILIEAKPAGVAVHYRAAPELEDDAVSALTRAVDEFQSFHVIRGKMVVEARPVGADKGAAVDALLALPQFSGRTPIFLGDDVTDEDGFAAVARHGGVGVKIGPGDTIARYRLPDVSSTYQLLEAFAARERSQADRSFSNTTGQEEERKR